MQRRVGNSGSSGRARTNPFPPSTPLNYREVTNEIAVSLPSFPVSLKQPTYITPRPCSLKTDFPSCPDQRSRDHPVWFIGRFRRQLFLVILTRPGSLFRIPASWVCRPGGNCQYLIPSSESAASKRMLHGRIAARRVEWVPVAVGWARCLPVLAEAGVRQGGICGGPADSCQTPRRCARVRHSHGRGTAALYPLDLSTPSTSSETTGEG